MCKEKWGKPHCNPWKEKRKIKELKSASIANDMRGYYQNQYLYELDYLIGEEEEGPRPVNSTFFS